MAFTDDFSGAAGQVLSARPGWTIGVGAECLQINGTNQLSKIASTASINFYYRTDDGATMQAVKADFLAANGNIGLLVLGSGTDLASANGYVARPNSATTVFVRRITNGVLDTVAILQASALVDLLAFELRATVAADGLSVAIQVFSHGVQVGATYTDTNAARKLTGRRGLSTHSTGPVVPALDTYSDNYAVVEAITVASVSVPFYEGVRNASRIPVAGTYTGAPATIESRLVDVDGSGVPTTVVAGFDWSTKVPAPAGGVYSFNHTGAPVGGPYRVQVRDSAVPGAVITEGGDRYVGAVFPLFGQSQFHILQFSFSGLAVDVAAKVFSLAKAAKAVPGAPTFARVTTSSGLGSGLQAFANQWQIDHPGVPCMLADNTIPGHGINTWIGDLVPNAGSGETWDASYKAWSGFVTTMLAAISNRWTATLWFQGTSDVTSDANIAAYPGNMDALAALYDAALAAGAVQPLNIVFPHSRSNDGPKTWNLRSAQYGKAISGGRWRLGGWLLDWQMDSNGSPHQANAAAGNPRGGTRLARGVGRAAFGNTLDITGPQVVSAEFNTARTAFDITFDRDIETPGGVTAGVQGVFVSINGGTTYPTAPASMPWTVSLLSARVARVLSTGAAFPSGTTRFDFARGVPFSSAAADADIFGPEADTETNAFARSIVDTSSFDGGRGMPAAPMLGTGRLVADASIIGIAALALAPATVTGSGTGTGRVGSMRATLGAATVTGAGEVFNPRYATPVSRTVTWDADYSGAETAL